jgi:outer membrane protein insertion porin family
MKSSSYIVICLCILALVYSGCRGTKNLDPGVKLYNGAEVRLLNPETVNNNKTVKSDLLDKAVPKPNKKLLGLFRTKLWFYNKLKPKKEKGLKAWMKKKLGEAPVLYAEGDTKRSILLMEKYLEDNGYFRADVQFDTVVVGKGREVKVIYSVTTEGQYFIKHVILPKDSDEVSRVIALSYFNMIVRAKQPYNIDKLKAERDKYATQIRSLGFYDFNREFIYYYIDTTLGEHQVDVYFRVKQPTDSTKHIKYHIRDITAYPVYSIDDDTISATGMDTIMVDSVKVIQNETFLRPKTVAHNILFRKGNIFSQKKHSYTVNHFLDLGIYKFVNLKYTKVGDSLDASIYLTPSDHQDISAEINVSTTSGNFIGSGGSFNYTNRNIFKGGELLSLTASGNVETQLGAAASFVNTIEVSGRAELGFPRFILPFSLKKVSLYYVPRTKFGFTETYQRRVLYYTINSFLFDFAYDWRQNQQIRHILTPLSVNSIRLFSTTSAFDDILRRNPTLRSSFGDVFIVGVQYSYIYNGMLVDPKRSYGYFRGNVDLAGNLIYPIAKAIDKNGTEPYKIAGRPFANYSRFDVDARYYLKFLKKHSYVNRVIAGIAIPYGNSDVTPYVKQFWIGGSTSVRAYRLRTLGPGSYSSPDSVDSDVFPDQTGDIKLEFNTELRFTIVSFLKGAIFADAGNVWLLRADPARPGGEFDIKRFYKELAIGTGLGLRLDFNFFVIRVDLSVPIRKPELPENDRWTFDKFDFGNKAWRKENMIWNIAIGYPF